MWSGISGATCCERVAVDLERLEVARVDADDAGARVHGALDLVLVVHLDERREPDGLRALDERLQGGLVQGGHDQQREVGAVRPGLPQLVRGDDEVLAQDRDVDLGAHGLQVGERTAEAALLGQYGDDGGAARLVVGGEPGRVGDRGERALGRAGALDLADHLDAVAAQGGHTVLGGGRLGRALLELVEADARLPLREVGTDSVDDLVEHTHASGPLPDGGAVEADCPEEQSTGHSDDIRRRAKAPHPVDAGPTTWTNTVDQGWSQPPRGRFRTTVKTRTTAPTAHRWGRPRSIRTGRPACHPYGPYGPQDGEDGVARDGERVVPESGREIAVHERVGAAQTAAAGAVDPRVVEQRAGGVVARLVRVDGPDVREAHADRGEDTGGDGQPPQRTAGAAGQGGLGDVRFGVHP